jgi:hypothetical protein
LLTKEEMKDAPVIAAAIGRGVPLDELRQCLRALETHSGPDDVTTAADVLALWAALAALEALAGQAPGPRDPVRGAPPMPPEAGSDRIYRPEDLSVTFGGKKVGPAVSGEQVAYTWRESEGKPQSYCPVCRRPLGSTDDWQNVEGERFCSKDCSDRVDEARANLPADLRSTEHADHTPSRRFMVCKDCLKTVYGGARKACGHGWDMLAGKPLAGTCSECGLLANDLHCPDGPRRPPAGPQPAPVAPDPRVSAFGIARDILVDLIHERLVTGETLEFAREALRRVHKAAYGDRVPSAEP